MPLNPGNTFCCCGERLIPFAANDQGKMIPVDLTDRAQVEIFCTKGYLAANSVEAQILHDRGSGNNKTNHDHWTMVGQNALSSNGHHRLTKIFIDGGWDAGSPDDHIHLWVDYIILTGRLTADQIPSFVQHCEICNQARLWLYQHCLLVDCMDVISKVLKKIKTSRTSRLKKSQS